MLLQQLLNGIGIGCTYALIALGYNLSFRVLKVVNLAYGEIFMASAFAALVCSTVLTGHPLIVVAVAMATAVFTGLLIHFVAVKPLGDVLDSNSPRHLSVLISTLGCSLVLQNLAVEVFGAYPQRVPALIPTRTYNLAGAQFDLGLLLNLVVSFVAMALLSIFLSKTSMGLRIRALSENPELSLCTGIRISKDQIWSIVISSALAGVAALLITQTIGTVSPFLGLSYGFKGLVVIIVGGIGNMYGAVLVALLLGVSEVFTVAYLSSSYRDAVAFALLVALLVGRERLQGRLLLR